MVSGKFYTSDVGHRRTVRAKLPPVNGIPQKTLQIVCY